MESKQSFPKPKPFSYSVLRYSHDPTSGEAINVGVLLYSGESGFAALEIDENYGHLVDLYRGFRKDDFALMLTSLTKGIKKLTPRLQEPSLLESLPETALDVARLLLPDQGGSFRFGTLGRGRGRGMDLENEAKALFTQLIKKQRPETKHWNRRNSEAVWRYYREALNVYGIPSVLEEREVETPSLPILFKHTYQNGRCHALEPLSLEYAKTTDITNVAAKWRGIG
ncbi:MAG: DUF3037 domain-containing protein, partial [Proteobacteria bacterium]